MRKIFVLVIAFASLFSVSLINAENFSNQDKEILKAMEDEMQRSMDELYLESLERPYYIEYTITIAEPLVIGGSLGSIKDLSHNPRARLNVEVKVGDYEFDNTNFFDFGLNFFGSGDDEERFSGRPIALEPDYQNLRRELWLATDAAYKQAAEILSKKQAAIKNRIRRDTTHDFLKIEPSENYFISDNGQINVQKYKALVKRLSAVFMDYPQITISNVGFEYIPEKTYFLNSEGMKYIKNDYYTGLEIAAFTQAEDGMPLTDMYTANRQSAGRSSGE